jgi:hypothetical protein
VSAIRVDAGVVSVDGATPSLVLSPLSGYVAAGRGEACLSRLGDSGRYAMGWSLLCHHRVAFGGNCGNRTVECQRRWCDLTLPYSLRLNQADCTIGVCRNPRIKFA